MDALSMMYPLLKSHETVDLLIMMLGTNDCKERFHSSAALIGQGMNRLILKAKTVDCWGRHGPDILVVAPPPVMVAPPAPSGALNLNPLPGVELSLYW